MFYTLFWNFDNSSAIYDFFVIVKIKCKTWNISTSVATLGPNWVAIEAKSYEEFKFLGFMRYFWARFQQSSKNHLEMAFLGSISDIYKDCGNLAEK